MTQKEIEKQIKWTKIGNLYWSEVLGLMFWDEGKKKCEELGGRMPSRIELIDLCDNHYDKLKKLDNPGANFWSSTEHHSGTTPAWYVYLPYGYAYSNPETNRNYVRCVKENL